MTCPNIQMSWVINARYESRVIAVLQVKMCLISSIKK